MTLRELLNQIESTQGKSVPRASVLRNSGVSIVAKKEIKDSIMTVYKNGFAIYATPIGITVFRADYCGGYTYFHRDEETSFTEEYFLEADWWVRLFLEGEDRLVHNMNASNERYSILYDPDDFERDSAFVNLANDIESEIYTKELVRQAYSMMTERQREFAELYYLEGMGTRDIAKKYDISSQNVAKTLKSVKKKFEKLLKIKMIG